MKEKILRFYRLYRVYILAFVAIVVCSIIAIAIFPKSFDSKVKEAIAIYYKDMVSSKGQSVKSITIENLDYRLVNETSPDTLLWVSYKQSGSDYYDKALRWLRLGDSTKTKQMEDSALVFYALADNVSKSIAKKAPGRNIYTRCLYLVEITTDSEHYTESGSIILDENLSVVWPAKK